MDSNVVPIDTKDIQDALDKELEKIAEEGESKENPESVLKKVSFPPANPLENGVWFLFYLDNTCSIICLYFPHYSYFF